MFRTHPGNVVEGFLALHLLEPAPIVEAIEYCHTGAELKKLLKERDLKVSGRKAEQAQRLLDADPEGMRRLAAEHQIVRCTPVASDAVQAWLESANGKASTSTMRSGNCLAVRHTKNACPDSRGWAR